MKDGLQLVRDLLSSRNWDAVILSAEHLLVDGDISADGRAFCHYAKCRALSNLDRYGAALEPGRVAEQLATESHDWDLVGRTLLELGWIYFNLTLHEDAIGALARFLQHAEKFGDEIKLRQVDVLIDLGSNYRSLGEYELALTHFLRAWDQCRQADTLVQPAAAERARSQAVWEALRLGQLDLAQRLLPAGDRHVEAFPSDDRGKAGHYIDRAQYNLLTRKWDGAKAWALKAIPHAEKHPELMARVFLIVYTLSMETERYDDALVAALVALQAAQRDSRHDLISEVQSHLDQLRLRAPDLVAHQFGETLQSLEVLDKRR